tara:strand:- start:271 stop:804 length:534 start_codon:yes stop_codon:yes gene_type:complete
MIKKTFKWKESKKSVFFEKEKEVITLLNKKNLEFLKKTKNQKNNKSRVCLHKSDRENIHEMIVFHKKGSYVRPHKHLNKLESFFIISGEVILVIFNKNGKPVQKIEMGDYNSGKTFFYKMKKNYFHTQIIKKDTMFKEVTNGPFKKNKTLNAKWSPEDQKKSKVKKYLLNLKNYKIK